MKVKGKVERVGGEVGRYSRGRLLLALLLAVYTRTHGGLSAREIYNRHEPRTGLQNERAKYHRPVVGCVPVQRDDVRKSAVFASRRIGFSAVRAVRGTSMFSRHGSRVGAVRSPPVHAIPPDFTIIFCYGLPSRARRRSRVERARPGFRRSPSAVKLCNIPVAEFRVILRLREMNTDY